MDFKLIRPGFTPVAGGGFSMRMMSFAAPIEGNLQMYYK